MSVAGTLTYRNRPDGLPYVVVDQSAGIYTDLPALGATVAQGQALYRVNDTPVVLLHGTTPAYRALSAGESGADVAELNADLVALGDLAPADLGAVPGAFGPATTAALQRLQAALGEPQTGALAVGQAVFEPGALRITALSVAPGGTAVPGQTVMTASSTTREVHVALDVSQQTDVKAGDTVTITLPDNRSTAGTVTAVGTVATCLASPAAGDGPTSGAAAPASGDCSTGTAASSSTATVDVAITPSDPGATGTWDQAPVQVGISSASVADALAVPVTALLARPGGGYAVEVVGGDGSARLVAITLGLFDDADGLVQVIGAGLSAGQRVVVPAT
ncbi:MAG TPA: peptidoglycan-binding protein [Acidimicrobiales bacterium]|nr:peptidoglycan-binding protein [Acidimicrobiales bacterium]